MKIKLLLSLVIFYTSVNLNAQTPTLIKDINTAGNSNPQKLIHVNGTTYFIANTSTNGNELWKTDGTETGTVLVKDINPGTGNPSIGKITAFNSKIYFRAYNPTNGYEIWESDGTEIGTKIMKEMSPGNGNIDPSNLVVFNGSLYFTERNSSTGVNLWKSDGTETGTVLLKNLYTSGNASNASYFSIMNNELFFIASENALFSSDIWKTDGTANGTSLVITMGGQTGELITVGNKLFFGYAGEGGAGTNKGLYVTNGTTNGTQKVKDLNLLNMINFPTNGTAIAFKNELIFTANDGVNGEELWKSDGTETGTVMIKDLVAGPGSGFDAIPYITKGTDSKFYFVVNDENGFRELWVSDASTSGTQLLDTPNLGSISPTNLYAYNGYLFYRAKSNILATGDELWRTDGSTIGTKLLVDIWPGITSSSPSNFCGANNTLYFSATDGSVGIELYGMAVSPVNTGLNNTKQLELKVYPNPAEDKISFARMLVCSCDRYSIVDMKGSVVQEGILENNSIDISSIEKGVYVLRVGGMIGKVVKN